MSFLTHPKSSMLWGTIYSTMVFSFFAMDIGLMVTGPETATREMGSLFVAIHVSLFGLTITGATMAFQRVYRQQLIFLIALCTISAWIVLITAVLIRTAMR